MKFKKKYFNNVKNETESKSFCHKCKSYFSNKFSKGDSKILLIKIEDVIDKSTKVANFLNYNSCDNGFLRSSEFSFNYLTEFIDKVLGTCNLSDSLRN